MKAVRIAKRFLQKFAHLIVACLSCYDRMIFKGYLQIGGDEQLNGWVDGVLKIRRKDFIPQLADFSQQLVEYSKRMAQRGLGFVQEDNTFTQLEDPKAAQRLADRFLEVRWRGQLNRWAHLVNPLLQQHPWFCRLKYYWVIDQAEYATDVIFRDKESLQLLYPRLLDHAVVNFSAQDILTFLGRRLHWRFDGEVLTECKKDRWPGARIKHRMKGNWLKMYDKLGIVLRIETVINQPREFKVRRLRERKGTRQMVWCPMNKGIANLYQYHAMAMSANVRYLEALSWVSDPALAYQQVDKLARPQVVGERSDAGFKSCAPRGCGSLSSDSSGRPFSLFERLAGHGVRTGLGERPEHAAALRGRHAPCCATT